MLPRAVPPSRTKRIGSPCIPEKQSRKYYRKSIRLGLRVLITAVDY